ncbi:MAG: GNAT family protein [Flavobacteriales bacterium]|nr:GNAT family protein [Flavobacteriales bacterium]
MRDNAKYSCNIRKTIPSDVDMIMLWENDPNLWEVTEDKGPFSRQEIEAFVNGSGELDRDGQERWMIESSEEKIVGCIDIFNYDRQNKSAGIGVVIVDVNDRKKGFAYFAIAQLIEQLKLRNRVDQLHCIIHPSNTSSIALFSKLGFIPNGESSFNGNKVLNYFHTLAP